MTLPKGWAEAMLGEIADTKLGKMLDAAKNKGEPVPYLRNINVRWGSFDLSNLLEMKVTPPEFDELAVRDGDLFVCEGGEPGRAAVWRQGQQRIVFQKALHRVRTLDGIEPDYVARFLAHAAANNTFADLLTGTTIKHLPQVALQRISLNVPPAGEQRRIVAKLDALTARLARARAELDRVPVLASRLRRNAASKVLATAGACQVRFADVLDYKGGSQPPKSTFHAEPAEGRVRLLQIRDFASDKKAVYITDNGKWPRCTADDIMIGRYGASVGKVLTGKSGAYNVALVKMIFDRSAIHPRFLFHWLNSSTFQDRLKEISRSAQDGFNKDDLADLPFPRLPLAHQIEIAGGVEAAFAGADRLEAEAARARALLDRLESAILARAFQGELVPQDPCDEPASVLLARIRARRAAEPRAKRGRKFADVQNTAAVA